MGSSFHFSLVPFLLLLHFSPLLSLLHTMSSFHITSHHPGIVYQSDWRENFLHFFLMYFFLNIFKWVVYYFINLWFFNCAHYSRIQKPMLCLVLLLSYFLSLANFLVFLISSVAGDRALSVLGLVLWVDILLF